MPLRTSAIMNNCLFTNCFAGSINGGVGLHTEKVPLVNVSNTVISDCTVHVLCMFSHPVQLGRMQLTFRIMSPSNNPYHSHTNTV